jgi:hypothetical protein
MGYIDTGLKLGGQALSLGKKLFGVGAPKAVWNDKYAKVAGLGWSKGPQLVQKANKAGVIGRYAGRGVAGASAADALSGGRIFGGAGPEGDEFQERAYNQLRYGVDMTDAQMEEAHKGGMEFQDTGMIGEGGLNEEQVMRYIAAESEDKRGTGQKISSGLLSAMSMIPGYGTLIGTPTEMLYDSKLKGARNETLSAAVGKLKADFNEGKIRRDMESKQGKFMAEGLLPKDFGRGNVRQQGGGVKPPVDREAMAEEAAALKEYESIKERDGVHAALAHPSALKAGRQVYLDVQEAAGGDKNTAEALLSGVGGQSGVGLTDQETMQKYYGDPEKNELANRATAAEATLSTQTKEAAAQQAAAERAFAEEAAKIRKTGPMSLRPAEDAEGVRRNREAIVARNGYHGESPQAEMQRSYFEDRGVPTERGMNQRLEAAADYAYEKQYGVARNSPEATAQLLYRHALKVQQAQKAYQDNRAKMADIEYAKHIVKPGDPDYKLGPKVTASTPDEMAQADRDSAASMGDGSVPAAPTPVAPAPLPAQVRASAAVQTAPAPSRAALLGPRATVPPTAAPTAMSPTPNGVGTANRGTGLPNLSLPQVPDIGAPVRNAVDRALTQQSSRPSNVMAPTPYGIGTATPGVPQAPDIGAPVRNAVQGALTQQSSPPGVVPQGPMGQTEIAKMLAEQKRKEIEARNKANPQRSPISRPNPMGRFIR